MSAQRRRNWRKALSFSTLGSLTSTPAVLVLGSGIRRRSKRYHRFHHKDCARKKHNKVYCHQQCLSEKIKATMQRWKAGVCVWGGGGMIVFKLNKTKTTCKCPADLAFIKQIRAAVPEFRVQRSKQPCKGRGRGGTPITFKLNKIKPCINAQQILPSSSNSNSAWKQSKGFLTLLSNLSETIACFGLMFCQNFAGIQLCPCSLWCSGLIGLTG